MRDWHGAGNRIEVDEGMTDATIAKLSLDIGKVKRSVH